MCIILPKENVNKCRYLYKIERKMKVSVIGAGNVGATCANVLANYDVAKEVVLLDIKDGFAEGKALDIWETAAVLNSLNQNCRSD